MTDTIHRSVKFLIYKLCLLKPVALRSKEHLQSEMASHDYITTVGQLFMVGFHIGADGSRIIPGAHVTDATVSG